LGRAPGVDLASTYGKKKVPFGIPLKTKSEFASNYDIVSPKQV
jgi:hypothetical protein